MKGLLKSISYIFHPLFMPLLGVSLFVYCTPRYFNPAFLYSKLFATAIVTIIIPILSFFMLRNLKLVTSIDLQSVRERAIPLALQIVFTLLLLNYIYNGYEIPEIYFFFIGIIGSSAGAILLALVKFKVSLHMIAVASVLSFTIGLSAHYSANILVIIALLTLACGATASSRLLLKAHTPVELIIGFLLGFLSQAFSYQYWL